MMETTVFDTGYLENQTKQPAESQGTFPAAESPQPEWPKWIEDTLNPHPWKWLRFDGPCDRSHKIGVDGKEYGRGSSRFSSWDGQPRFKPHDTEPAIIREYREKQEAKEVKLNTLHFSPVGITELKNQELDVRIQMLCEDWMLLFGEGGKASLETEQLRQRLAECSESNKTLDENNQIVRHTWRVAERECMVFRKRVEEVENNLIGQDMVIENWKKQLAAVTAERDAAKKDAERWKYVAGLTGASS